MDLNELRRRVDATMKARVPSADRKVTPDLRTTERLGVVLDTVKKRSRDWHPLRSPTLPARIPRWPQLGGHREKEDKDDELASSRNSTRTNDCPELGHRNLDKTASADIDPAHRPRNRKLRSHEKPVPTFLLKQGIGRVFQTASPKPRKTIAQHTTDQNWWGHPVLLMDYDVKLKRAKVLLISSLGGLGPDGKYTNANAPMRKRLLFVRTVGGPGPQRTAAQSLEVYVAPDNLGRDSYIKINVEIEIEAEFMLPLKKNLNVRLTDESLSKVKALVKAFTEDEARRNDTARPLNAEEEAVGAAYDAKSNELFPQMLRPQDGLPKEATDLGPVPRLRHSRAKTWSGFTPRRPSRIPRPISWIPRQQISRSSDALTRNGQTPEFTLGSGDIIGGSSKQSDADASKETRFAETVGKGKGKFR